MATLTTAQKRTGLITEETNQIFSKIYEKKAVPIKFAEK